MTKKKVLEDFIEFLKVLDSNRIVIVAHKSSATVRIVRLRRYIFFFVQTL